MKRVHFIEGFLKHVVFSVTFILFGYSGSVFAQTVASSTVDSDMEELVESDAMSFTPQWWSNNNDVYIDWNDDGDFDDTDEHPHTWPAGAGPFNFTLTPPSGSAGTVTLRLSCSGGYQDHEVTITSASPILSSSPLTSFGNVCTGTDLGPYSFTITGQTLTTANVTVAALSGFTYSETPSGSYTTTLSLPCAGGSFSDEVYVKFSPVDVQSYNGNIVVGGGGASNINVAAVGSGVTSMAPAITTPTALVTGVSTATLGGNITVAGCSENVTERGIYWSTTNGFADGAGTKVSETGTFSAGVFTVNVTGLSTSTTIYYKVFATNATGTTYTTQSSFSNVPTTYYVRQTGNWNDAATWSTSSCGNATNTGTYPKAIDHVNICQGATVTLTEDAACNNLTFPNSATGTLAFGDYDLTVNGEFFTDWSESVTISQGIGYLIMAGASKDIKLNTAKSIKNLRISSNAITKSSGNNVTLTVTGDLDFNNSTAFTQSNGDMTVTGSVSNSSNLVFTESGRTFNVSGSSSSDITFDGLVLSSGTLNFGAKDIVVNDVTYSGGTYTHTGWLTMSDTFTASNNITISKFRVGSASVAKAGGSTVTVSSQYDHNCLTESMIFSGSPTESNQVSGCGPSISVSESALTGFSYVFGAGPSSEQTFTVSGSSLTDDIVITAPTNYEISETSGAGYTSPITLTQSGGDVSTTTIYVRLKSGLSTNSYNSEDIAIAVTGDALNETVTCSGNVTAVPTVVVSSGPAVSSGDIGQNTTNNIVSSIAMTVSDASATVSAIAFTNTGDAIYTTDITNYKLYYTSTSNTFATGTLLGTITSGSSFTGLSQSLSVGGPYYFWITADVESAATVSRTIIISQITSAGITISGASKSGANSAGGTKTIIATDPVVTLGDNTVVPAGNIFINTTNNIISRFKLDVTGNMATLNTVTFTTTGDAVTTTDLTNFKLWYNTTNAFGSASAISTITTGLDAASSPHSFSGLSQSIAVGTGYFWITTDIPGGATDTRTVAVSAMTSSAITHSGGSPGDNVSGSATASGSQQILTAVPKNYYYVGANNGDWSTASNWNTGSCSSGTVDGYPTINDNVYINCNNDRVVRLSENAACASLTIGQQNSGVDLYGYSFTVAGNVDFGTGNQNRFTNTAGTTNTLSIGGNVLIDSYQGYMNIPTYTVTIDGNVTLSADQSNIQTTTGSISIGGNLLIENYQAHITTTTGNVTVDGNVTFTAGQAKIATTDGDVTVGGTYTNTSGSESRIEWATGTTTITGDISVTKSNGQEPLKCTGTGWFEMDGGLSQTITASNAIAVPKFRQSNTGFTKAGAGGFTISNIFDQNCGPVEPSGVTVTTPANTINDVCGIIISDTEFTGFNYILATGPSDEQSFTVEGILLNDDIVISAPTNYEISETSGSGFTTSITLTEVAGSVAETTIYIRLKAGLSKASYNSEEISLASSGHASKTVTCSGSVSAPLSATNSTLTPTTVSITADGVSTVSLTVQAKDEDDLNIPSGGLTVTITKDSGLGTIGAVVDNGDGTYTAVVTSTTTTGTGVFVATIEGNTVNNGGGTQTEATITYSAGPPANLSVVEGNNQTVAPGEEVPIAPSILVTDANGNPVSGIDVVFTITAGDGSVTSATTTTNASGIATVGSWTLGAVAGTNTLIATATAETVTSSIAYPFPQAQFRDTYPYGIVATNANYERLQELIDDWVGNYYVESASEDGDCGGVGCARIKWDNPDQTVSEGIGYGMMIFVYSDNEDNQYQAKFDSLWAYYDYWSTSNGGLMEWRINGFETQDGDGAATDAELDVVLSLMMAHKQWGSDGTVNYIEEAEAMLAKIYDNEVSASGFLKPGDQWNEVQNPSYAALFAIKLADEIQTSEGFTATRDWATLYANMQDYLTYYQDPTTGLWPNWTNPDNITTGVCQNPNFNTEGCLHGLDALRTPWRVAWDYAWYGSASSLASLDILAGWLGSSYVDDDPEEITGKLNLDGTLAQAYPLDESGIMGGIAAAYMGDYDSESQTNLNTWYANLINRDMSNPGVLPLNDPLVLADPDTYGYQYYSPTTQILFALTLSGNTPNFNSFDPVVSGSPIVFTALGESELPIELVAFDAIPQENAVQLFWKTETETNNDYFTLHRSNDGKEFLPIAQIPGAGTSSQPNYYYYLDNSFYPGITYYQLQQTDYDGTSSESKIISVDITVQTFTVETVLQDNATQLKIYFADESADNEIVIMNSLGQIVYEEIYFYTAHTDIILELPPGVYMITNTTSESSSFTRFLVK